MSKRTEQLKDVAEHLQRQHLFDWYIRSALFPLLVPVVLGVLEFVGTPIGSAVSTGALGTGALLSYSFHFAVSSVVDYLQMNSTARAARNPGFVHRIVDGYVFGYIAMSIVFLMVYVFIVMNQDLTVAGFQLVDLLFPIGLLLAPLTTLVCGLGLYFRRRELIVWVSNEIARLAAPEPGSHGPAV